MSTKGNAPTLASFHNEVEQLLRRQLKEHPQLHDARIKLLELYHETGRGEDFLKEARALSAGFDRKARATDWNRVVSMARMLGLADPLFQQEEGGRIEFISSAGSAKGGQPKAEKIVRFGEAPNVQPLFQALAAEYAKVRADPKFLNEFDRELMLQINRPSALYHARRLSEEVGGAQIFFKREDLTPQGTRLTINAIGEAVLARRLGRPTLVTSSANGMRGVIVASVAARMGLKALVFMDRQDMQLHATHIFRMRLLGAEVREVQKRHYPRNDLRYAALEEWAKHADEMFILLGLEAAPQPYPLMMREFSAVIGRETGRQVQARVKRAPALLAARAGTNSDAIGFLEPFLTEDCRRVCVEGHPELPGAGAPATAPGPVDPARSGMTDAQKRVAGAILEGMEYPSVVREHGFLKDSGRVEYVDGTKCDVRRAITLTSRLEGIVPAIETAHVIAWVLEAAKALAPDQVAVVMLAESGDKDLWELSRTIAPR